MVTKPYYPPTRLTERFVERLPRAPRNPSKGNKILSYAVWDIGVKGLFVFVGEAKKSYCLKADVYSATKRTADGRKERIGTRQIRLGEHPRTTVEQARRDAEAAKARFKAGWDPQEEPAAPPPAPRERTLSDAWADYRADLVRLGRQPRTIADMDDIRDRYFGEKWLNRPLRDIGHDRDGVKDLHNRLTAERGPYAANHAIRALRSVYRAARLLRPELPPPPTEVIKMNPEPKRKAVIRDLPGWWAKVRALKNPVRRDLHIFMLLTGMRRGATVEARAEDFHPAEGYLHVPRPKGGPDRAFNLPLSTYLVELLEARVADNREVFGADCPWLWPSHTSASGHVQEPKEPDLPSPHVSRHTFITACHDAGLRETDIKLIVNHHLEGAHGGYVHGSEMGNRLRFAMEQATQHILRRADPPAGQVVPLRAVEPAPAAA